MARAFESPNPDEEREWVTGPMHLAPRGDEDDLDDELLVDQKDLDGDLDDDEGLLDDDALDGELADDDLDDDEFDDLDDDLVDLDDEYDDFDDHAPGGGSGKFDD